MKLNRKAIDLLRAKHCLSMVDLASKAGISAATIYAAYKRDIDAVPIGKLAKALNTTVESIIVQEDQ